MTRPNLGDRPPLARFALFAGADARALSRAEARAEWRDFAAGETVLDYDCSSSEVRLVLDAVPQAVIPAEVSFVSDVAQFTPKTVETVEERLKLTFRVRARIAPELLRRYIRQVKTGLPGMAYIRLDPTVEWPGFLSNVVK